LKTIKFIFILIFFISLKTYSQEDNIIKLHQLSGTIYSKNESPLPFVNILVKHYKRGTISDFDGFFSLVVQPNDTIIFSSVGFCKQFFVIPDTIKTQDFYVEVRLKTDTIMLREVIIFPWNTYEKFKNAFVNLKVPKDDLERAIENFRLIEKQLVDGDFSPDASLSYKNFMQQTYNQLYYAGQLPPNNLLNPLAWSKFFEALKNGDLKRK
jgi:hypothetical protein